MFASSDLRVARRDPLWLVEVNGEAWYGAWAPMWLVKGADCRTLQRAMEKYGVEAAVPNVLGLDEVLGRWLAAPAEAVTLGEPWIAYEDEKYAFPVVSVTPDHTTSATAVAYVTRRYGGDGVWLVSHPDDVVRYEVSPGEAVAVLRLWDAAPMLRHREGKAA